MFAEYYITVANALEETTALTIKESKWPCVFRETGFRKLPSLHSLSVCWWPASAQKCFPSMKSPEQCWSSVRLQSHVRKYSGTSLVVQWREFCTTNAGAQVGFLIRELDPACFNLNKESMYRN